MAKSVQGMAVGGGSELLELRLAFEPAEDPQTADTYAKGTYIPWLLDPLQTIEFYSGNPWLAGIGKLIADGVSGGIWSLKAREYDLTGQPLDSASSDEFARAMAWLSREDICQDGVSLYGLKQFLRTAITHLEQTGNLFIVPTRDLAGRNLWRMAVMLPQYVRYIVDRGLAGEERSIQLYQLDPFFGAQYFVEYGKRPRGDRKTREFVHVRLPSTLSSVYGLPPWLEARDAVALDNAHRNYVKSFFSNHAAPRWMVDITQDPAWTGPEASQDNLEAVYGHIKNYLAANRGDMAGRNLITQYPGGIKVVVTPLDHKLDDPTFATTTKNIRDQIMAVRHVSLIDLGLPEGGYRATAETQSNNFRAQVLEPAASPLIALINRLLHTPQPSGLGITQWDFHIEFRDAAALLQRIETLVKSTGVPFMTQDEARAEMGLEGMDLDDIYIPANMVAVDQVDIGEDSLEATTPDLEPTADKTPADETVLQPDGNQPPLPKA
ncbi:MAG: phage portal protein [Thermaceae bacterium]|nr:phage portal protein [Thermaceae bacterium]